MNIIFAGSPMRGYFAKELIEQSTEKGTIKILEESKHIKEHEAKILLLGGGFDAIIYDSDQYIDEAAVIADTIQKIYNANHVQPIVMVPTDNVENVIIKQCMDRGIKSFINPSRTAAEQKEHLVKLVTGYFDANGDERPDIRRIQEKRAEEKTIENTFRTIGVVGACHRIGTTTQCIQIVKYLTYMGYKACFVEMNENRYRNRTSWRDLGKLSYVEKSRFIYEPEIDRKDKGIVSIEKVDMLYLQDKLNEIKSDYDFFVYDYGVYTESGFNKMAFLKDDMQIFVVGSDVTEIDYTTDIAQNISYKNAKLVFSFTAEQDREELMGLMDSVKIGEDGNAYRAYFAGYTPTPFVLSDIPLYQALFPELNANSENLTPEQIEQIEGKKKKGFSFGKRRKK